MNKIVLFFIVSVMAMMGLATPVISETGSDPIQWFANLTTDANILHKDVFPGIDLIYSGNQQRIDATLIVNPNADPDDISLDFTGITNLEMNEQNHAIVQTSEGTVELFPPSLFQEYNGKRYKVEGSYVTDLSNKLGVQVSTYNHNYPLKIKLVAYFTGSSGPEGLAPVITATKTDSLLDSDGDMEANPGDTLKYTIIIRNTGDMDATDVVFDETIDPNTTLVPGSITTTPLAQNESFTILEDTPTTLSLDGVDPDGDNLTFTEDTAPGKGSLGAFTSTGPNSANVTYTPNADANNNTAPAGDDTFLFQVEDDDNNTDLGTGTVTITPVNDAPTFTCGPNQPHNIGDGPAITVPGWATNIAPGPATATDESGQTLSLITVSNTNTGLFSVQPTVNLSNGNLSYTLAGVSGLATITFQAQDNGGTGNGGVDSSAQCSFDITVQAPGAPPVAVDDPNGGLPANSAPSGPNAHPYHTALNTQLNVPDGSDDLLTNDTLGTPTASIFGYGTTSNPTAQTTIGQPTATDQGGTVTVFANGSFTYDPPSATFTGLDQFAYRLQNTQGSDDANVTVAVGFRPQALADSRTATGNVRINTSTIPFSVLDNDQGDQISVTSMDAASANGGDVVHLGSGEFTYDPPAGFESSDAFNYTMGNGFGDVSAAVTVTVSDMIWFIDKSVASNGNGTLNSPYKTIADYNSAVLDQAGDNIFLADDLTYSSGITLKDSQKLIGDGSSGTLAAAAGITLAPGSDALPVFSGTDPIISGISTVNGINLALNNTIRGLTVGNTPNGFSISGTTVGTFTIQETSVIGSGGALSISTSGTVGTVQFDQLSTTGPPAATDAINLTNVSGTISITSGTIISIVSGIAVDINGASSAVTMTYPGSITKQSSGKIINIANNAGTLNFNGAVNQNFTTGEGIHITNLPSSSTVNFNAGVNLGTGTPLNNDAVTLTSNTGATINFLGGLNIGTTSTGDGFVATGGGTVNVTGSSNTVTTTTGTGVNISGTTIGGSGVTFQSIDVNGATNGIVLNNTGTSGGLTVTGVDGPCGNTLLTKDCDGGTIKNTTGHGISLTSTKDVSLSFMEINSSGINGINGINVNGLTISNTDVEGSNTRNVLIDNNTGTSNVTVTNSTFDNAGSAVGLDIQGSGTANITLNVTGSSFTHNFAPQLKALADGSSTIDATITTSTFVGDSTISGNLGVDLDAFNNGQITFAVTHNTFQPFRSHAINIFATGSGTATGRVDSNSVLGSKTGAGIRVVAEATGVNSPSITVQIDSNNISNVRGGGLAGIHIEARDGNIATTGTATVAATVNNNIVSTVSADAAIQVYVSDKNVTRDNETCVNVTNNNTTAVGGAFGATDFFYGNDPTDGSDIGIALMQGYLTTVAAAWTANGNVDSGGFVGRGFNNPITGAGTCATP